MYYVLYTARHTSAVYAMLINFCIINHILNHKNVNCVILRFLLCHLDRVGWRLKSKIYMFGKILNTIYFYRRENSLFYYLKIIFDKVLKNLDK